MTDTKAFDDIPVSLLSRVLGLPVVDEDNPTGPHSPDCAGCHGEQTGETCPLAVERRAYAQQFEASLSNQPACE